MKICLFEPSSPSNINEIRNGLRLLRKGLSNIDNLELRAFSSVSLSNDKLSYLASNDSKKALSFKRAVKGNWDFMLFTRGGYGILRWLSLIHWEELSPFFKDKIFIGFSDATFLANTLVKFGGRFLHAPMLNTLSYSNKKTQKSFFSFLQKKKLEIISGRVLVKGDITGTLIGGNLTCLSHLIGTDFEPDWRGKILFLEDCNEAIYRLDRLFTHLFCAKVFNKVSAVVLGNFLLPKGEDEAHLFCLLKDRFGTLKKPVLYDLPCGHGDKNIPLLFGERYQVSTSFSSLIPISQNH